MPSFEMKENKTTETYSKLTINVQKKKKKSKLTQEVHLFLSKVVKF